MKTQTTVKSKGSSFLANRGLFTIIIIPLLIFIIVVSWYIIYRQARQINTLRNSLISVTTGDRINYFDLIGTDNEKIDASMLNRDNVSLIFIFKQPCAVCNTNISIWRRIAGALRNEAKIYGIWFGDHKEMFSLQEKGRLGFKLYMPIDIDKFKKEFNLKGNHAQTILYYNNKVNALRIQDLDGDDYTAIMRQAKQALQHFKQLQDKKEENNV